MRWSRLLKRYGYQVDDNGAELDPFLTLNAQASLGGTKPASVTYSVGISREYGEVKCQASVTLVCPQHESAINMAGELAYRKAVELVNDGASSLGMQLIEPLEDT